MPLNARNVVVAAVVGCCSLAHGFSTPSTSSTMPFVVRRTALPFPSALSLTPNGSGGMKGVNAMSIKGRNTNGDASKSNSNTNVVELGMLNKDDVGASSAAPSTASSTELSSTQSSSSDNGMLDGFSQPIETALIDDPENAMVLRGERINRIALGNAFIIGSVAAAGLYELLHVNVEALLALWEYGLGQTSGPEVTKVAVAMDLFARLPMDAVRSYEQLVPTHPIFYKACTSGVAYALGDFVSQVYQGKTLDTLDLPRSLRSGAAGFIGHGPLCHYWLTFMETYLDFGGAWWATGIKVTADLTVWAVFLNAAYSFLIGMLAFRDPRDVWQDVKATSWPALRSAWRFWPFVHTVSFSHAVPMDLKLLWVDAMEVVWVTILSKVANEDKISKMNPDDDVKVNENVFKAVKSAHSTGTDPIDVVMEFGVDPSLEVDLARQIEAAEGQLEKEASAVAPAPLPQRVLGACWPLIVMWPILYGGYQLEKFLGFEI